ncbi:uroporphyrinogen decarboxylase family protein [bacterium]
MGKERFMTALGGGEPDMVPIWDMGINESCIINIAKHFMDDVPEIKFIHEMDPNEVMALLNTLLKVLDELDFDGATMPTLTGREIVGENLTRDKLGIVSKVTPHGEPFPIDGPVKSHSDLKNLTLPTPDDSWTLAVMFAKAQFQNRKAIVLHTPGTFKLSWSLRGSMETLFMDYMDDAKFVHELARKVNDYCLQVINAAFDKGVDAIILEGDLAMCENTLMSPGQYRDFIQPYHKELTDAAHARGGLIAKHSDGNLWPILDDLLDAGFDGIHPIQPQSMDIGDVKKHLTGKACVLGNIDCMYLLPEGTTDEVEESVKETIKIAAPGGGYILSSSNSIHPDVKPENAIAMFRAARKYGKYPIEL